MKTNFSNKILFLIFTLVFIGICLLFNFQTIIEYTPRSTHNWRQTDSASFSLHYVLNDMEFFKPGTMWHGQNNNGLTASECPWLYYLVAIFYKLFGIHEGFARTLNLLFFFLGSFALVKILYEWTQNLVASISIGVFIFSSPNIAFYGFNFIPNVPALGLAFIGWYFFYQYYRTPKMKWLLGFSISFLLAGLLKVTALISMIAIGGLWFLEITGLQKFKKEGKIFPNPFAALASFALPIAGSVGWSMWAKAYNKLHDSHLFLMGIRPFWEMKDHETDRLIRRLKETWFEDMFDPPLLGLCLFGVLFVIFTKRKHHPILWWMNLLCLLGSTCYFLLWMAQFGMHDYYQIEMTIVPIIGLITFFVYLNKNYPQITRSTLFAVCIAVFAFINIWQTRIEMRNRYSVGNNFRGDVAPVLYRVDEVQAFLKAHNIQYPDKVVSIPDISPNITLYHLRLKGYTEIFMSHDMEHGRVKGCAKKGAKYLIITDKKYLTQEDMQPVLKYPIASFEDQLFIYDIRPFGDG